MRSFEFDVETLQEKVVATPALVQSAFGLGSKG